MNDVAVRALAELEAVIERGLTTFVEVGQALLEIREHRLYRETHDSFEAYCRERWGFNRQRASQIIQAAEVSNMLDTPPANARQAAELARLKDDPDAVREVWAEVTEAKGSAVTAADVRKVVSRRLGDAECEDCGELFSGPVWHCPTCARHWADPGDDVCKNCLSLDEYTYRPGFIPDPDDEYAGAPRVGADLAEGTALLLSDDDIRALPSLNPSAEDVALSALVRLIGLERLDAD